MPSLRYHRLASALLPLANKFYKRQRSNMRVGRAEQVWVAQQQEIVAACCLKPVDQGHWLTALLVAHEQRQQGVATQLLRQVLAASSGPLWLFCQPQLLGFYQRLGFAPCAELPAVLAERLQRYQRKQPLLALVCRGTQD